MHTVYIYICIYTYIHTYTYTIFIYIYIYIYIHTYIHIYVHIYIGGLLGRRVRGHGWVDRSRRQQVSSRPRWYGLPRLQWCRDWLWGAACVALPWPSVLWGRACRRAPSATGVTCVCPCRCCSVVQCVLQCVAVCYIVCLWGAARVALPWPFLLWGRACPRAPSATGDCNRLQHTAAHCNTLQRTAARCTALQHTATQSQGERVDTRHLQQV